MRRTTNHIEPGSTTSCQTGVAHVETGPRNNRNRKWIIAFLLNCRCPVLVVLLAAVLLGSTFGSPVHSSTLRALVVGIDHYRDFEGEDGALQNLGGAVNDARDIAGTLRGMGISDLTVLENRQATRESMTSAWDELLERSVPGDTVLFTFAGHGGQETEKFKGTETDGKDEVLLLGGFRTKGPGSRERIFDNELFAWFQKAGKGGVRVIFVADSCHSGTLTRSIDARVSDVKFRTSEYTISSSSR